MVRYCFIRRSAGCHKAIIVDDGSQRSCVIAKGSQIDNLRNRTFMSLNIYFLSSRALVMLMNL